MRAAVLVGVCVATSHVAMAADPPDVARARDAYDRGTRAHAAGDYGAAARAFAEADAIAPTAASLEAAIEAAMRADDAVLGIELLERADARPYPDKSLTNSVAAARKRFANRTGTIRVDCKGPTAAASRAPARCLVSIDGRVTDATHPVVATVGPHAIIVERGDQRFERLIDVAPNAETLVSSADAAKPPPNANTNANNDAPPPREPPRASDKPKSTRTLSPVWFLVGSAATVGFGTAAVLSGITAVNNHDDFVARGCSPDSAGPRAANCSSLADKGEALTIRTNIFAVVTALFAINTAVLGGWYVNWSSSSSGTTASIGGKLP